MWHDIRSLSWRPHVQGSERHRQSISTDLTDNSLINRKGRMAYAVEFRDGTRGVFDADHIRPVREGSL